MDLGDLGFLTGDLEFLTGDGGGEVRSTGLSLVPSSEPLAWSLEGLGLNIKLVTRDMGDSAGLGGNWSGEGERVNLAAMASKAGSGMRQVRMVRAIVVGWRLFWRKWEGGCVGVWLEVVGDENVSRRDTQEARVREQA